MDYISGDRVALAFRDMKGAALFFRKIVPLDIEGLRVSTPAGTELIRAATVRASISVFDLMRGAITLPGVAIEDAMVDACAQWPIPVPGEALPGEASGHIVLSIGKLNLAGIELRCELDNQVTQLHLVTLTGALPEGESADLAGTVRIDLPKNQLGELAFSVRTSALADIVNGRSPLPLAACRLISRRVRRCLTSQSLSRIIK